MILRNFVCFKTSRKPSTKRLFWRNYEKEIIKDIHIKVSENALNRTKFLCVKFKEVKPIRTTYVKISVLGMFFFGTPDIWTFSHHCIKFGKRFGKRVLKNGFIEQRKKFR